MEKTICIIGSGIAGLASAIRMAAKGHNVHVFEQASQPGGKISQLRVDGFRFDTGPSLLTMPWLLDELFSLCGETIAGQLEYFPTKTSCKYFWEDGTILNAWNNPQEFIREASDKTGVNPLKIRKALHKSRQLYELTADVFLFNSLHRAGNLFSRHGLKALWSLHKLDALSSMHRRNMKNFGQKHLVQLFDRYATYNGSSPFLAPATLNIIAHLEHNTGAFFPVRGMYAITEALYNLARGMGVQFHLNTPVQEMVLENRRVKGIVANDNFYPADIVISNVDVVNFYKNLLPGEAVPKRQLQLQRSSSALVFFWGINRQFPELELHNVLFSESYQQEFDHLFQTKTISDDPTVYIYISSKIHSEDAPTGHENWYVMINAPENCGQDWTAMVKAARENIISKINRMLRVDIPQHILFERTADPQSIERDTGSYHGSLYGISSNGIMAAFNRHPNFRSRYKNLFFTGGSVHPGGGIPLCLASARIVDQEIKAAK